MSFSDRVLEGLNDDLEQNFSVVEGKTSMSSKIDSPDKSVGKSCVTLSSSSLAVFCIHKNEARMKSIRNG